MTAHIVKCVNCGTEVHGELYHLGFSNMECMYCDSCPRVLLLKDPTFYKRHEIEWPNLHAGDKGWEPYDRHLLPVYKKLESLFKPCVCGGGYRASSLPRCPACNEFILGGMVHEDKPVYWHMRHVFVTVGAVTDTEHVRYNAT